LWLFHPRDIINGRLVGGSGKDRQSSGQYHPTTSSTTALVDSSSSKPTAVVNVLAKLTSWLLFPLAEDDDDDDISLCDKTTTAGSKLASGCSSSNSSDNEEEEEEEDDDDEVSSTTTSNSSVSVGDLPARSPTSSRPAIDVETERELSEMNVSMSEIAEAYYAHQLIDQERHGGERRSGSDNSSSTTIVGGLFVSEESPDSLPGDHHRLDYEITQMDIARMARNASRHLDVDSILNLPTVTYQSRLALPRHKDLARHQHACSSPNRKTSTTTTTTNSSFSRDDGFSFVMVSGVKSSVLDSTFYHHLQGDHRDDGDDHQEEEEEMCVICLEAFQHGERLRVLPCDHSFHVGCIDRWLSGSHSYNECFTTGCPTCKKRPSTNDRNPVSPEMSTAKTTLDHHHDHDDDEPETIDCPLDGSVPSWAFANLGSALAMSQGR
jgi:Ring finger domain